MYLTRVENFRGGSEAWGVAQKICIHEASQSNFEADFRWIFQKIEKIYVFLKIICTTCRTVLIQSALCSPDLGECFRYPEHVSNPRKYFLGGLGAWGGAQKKDVCEASQSNFEADFTEHPPQGSEPPRKFTTRVRDMFWVSKTFT